jgi:hypothetical protein
MRAIEDSRAAVAPVTLDHERHQNLEIADVGHTRDHDSIRREETRKFPQARPRVFQMLQNVEQEQKSDAAVIIGERLHAVIEVRHDHGVESRRGELGRIPVELDADGPGTRSNLLEPARGSTFAASNVHDE